MNINIFMEFCSASPSLPSLGNVTQTCNLIIFGNERLPTILQAPVKAVHNIDNNITKLIGFQEKKKN